jgi:hypothetical protein
MMFDFKYSSHKEVLLLTSQRFCSTELASFLQVVTYAQQALYPANLMHYATLAEFLARDTGEQTSLATSGFWTPEIQKQHTCITPLFIFTYTEVGSFKFLTQNYTGKLNNKTNKDRK